jgi:hypothetical protein
VFKVITPLKKETFLPIILGPLFMGFDVNFVDTKISMKAKILLHSFQAVWFVVRPGMGKSIYNLFASTFTLGQHCNQAVGFVFML